MNPVALRPLLVEGEPHPAANHRRRRPAARRAPSASWLACFAAALARPSGWAPWPLAYEVATGIGTWGLNRRSAGRSTSPTSSSGSASATPAR